MTINDFLTFFNGIYCDYDGAYGDQCFDLANAYSRWIGGQRFTGATADLIFNQPGNFYTAIQNTPDGIPQRGDIVIWNWPHVGIATGANSSTSQFEVLEQNDPTNSNCHIKVYLNYNGVIGWLRPKSVSEGEVITKYIAQEITDSTKIPLLDNQEVQAIRSQLMDQARTIEDLKNQIISLNAKIAAYPQVTIPPVNVPTPPKTVDTTPSDTSSTEPLSSTDIYQILRGFVSRLWKQIKK